MSEKPVAYLFCDDRGTLKVSQLLPREAKAFPVFAQSPAEVRALAIAEAARVCAQHAADEPVTYAKKVLIACANEIQALSSAPSVSEEGYYLQDRRGYVGNDMLFWRKGGGGYTTNLDEAEVYTLEAAMRQHRCRDSDLPWPVSYIRSKSRPTVDHQHCDRATLAALGVEVKS